MEKQGKGPRMMRLVGFLLACIGGLILSSNLVATAKERRFPARAITIINPLKPGGGTDVELRNLSPYLQKYLGQPVIIRSIPGGGTTLAASYAARAKPDGYTIIASPLPQSILAQELHGTDSHVENFEFIYAWFKGPNDITVQANSPYKTFSDLLKASKKKPLKTAVAGIGSTAHLHQLLLEKYTGLKAVVIPYAGGGPSTAALMRGDVNFYPGLSTTSVRFVRAGKTRQLLILGPEPLEALPDTPTIYQLGYKDYPYIPFVRGVAAPPGTPRDRVEFLEATFKKAVDEPGFRAIMKKQGRPITIFTSKEYQKFAQHSSKLAKEYVPIMKKAKKKR